VCECWGATHIPPNKVLFAQHLHGTERARLFVLQSQPNVPASRVRCLPISISRRLNYNIVTGCGLIKEEWLHLTAARSKRHVPRNSVHTCIIAICRDPPTHSFTADWRNFTDPQRTSLKYVMIYGKVRTCDFIVVHNILTEGVFVGSQLRSVAGISFRRIVWVMINCCFVSDTICTPAVRRDISAMI